MLNVIIVLVLTFAMFIYMKYSKRNKQENQPPASLGEAYFREER